jgi:hypothetical protein
MCFTNFDILRCPIMFLHHYSQQGIREGFIENMENIVAL